MWLVVCFDLPMLTKRDKRNYIRFKNILEGAGFARMQFSMYTKHVPSIENAHVYEKNVQKNIPPGGHVRIFTFTDKQYGSHKVFFGKERIQEESSPQLSLFL